VERVVLYGNGPVAKSAYFGLKSDSPYEVVAFTVDRAFIESSTLLDLPLIPFDEIQVSFPTNEYKMMIAVGYVQGNKVRAEKFHQAKSMGYQMIRHISSTAIIAPDVVVGENSMVGENCIISNLVRIGDNVRIGAGCFNGHDTMIGDHCFLSNCAVVGGSTSIEPYCFIGLNATVRNKITIAKHCVIGAGAVILQNTKEKQVYLARPAELLPVSSDDLPLM
jgi:sugar O-acyltransferase (sialic acid O-acetyltransferase NeuD family)